MYIIECKSLNAIYPRMLSILFVSIYVHIIVILGLWLRTVWPFRDVAWRRCDSVALFVAI